VLIQRESRFLGSRIRMFSPDLPVGELIDALGAYSPAFITGYSTALVELARAARDGRLAITPAMIAASGEPISRAAKHELRVVFECVVRELYGATEGVVLATECGFGSLHANTDWFVLEPVDKDYQPVPPGGLSDTVLLTNLGNRIQPLIRYDLGDSIIVHQHGCGCGSAFPVIEVQGRQGEVLVFTTDHGTRAPIFPLALSNVVEQVPGVARCQIVRIAQAALEVRFDVTPGHPRESVWCQIRQALTQFFEARGIHGMEIRAGTQPPRRNPRSGKFSHVRSEMA
jgi:phenylacetate-CoA ligase